MFDTKDGVFREGENKEEGSGPVIITGKHDRHLAIAAAEVYGANQRILRSAEMN